MPAAATPGRLVDIGDTRLHVVERGSGPALLLLHGGPGLDHQDFADYLDPLAELHTLVLVDQRGHGRSAPADPATWTLRHLAADVVALARALGLSRYAVLGHSFGASVALRWAVDFPAEPGPLIVSACLPHRRYAAGVRERLRALEPPELRRRVADSWAREREVTTPMEVADLVRDQLPFHFADPRDPRIDEYARRAAGAVHSPAALRHFAGAGYGDVDVEDRLPGLSRPLLILAGRHDRLCPVAGALAIAGAVPGARLIVFERSAHMAFVEETERYIEGVRSFLAGSYV